MTGLEQKYDKNFKVCVYCTAYNHEDYIEKAMDGFSMQKTNFPVVSVIIDDASTDNTVNKLKQYFQKHFNIEDESVAYKTENDYGTVLFSQHKNNLNCYFAIILLNVNHHSQKKSKLPYISQWRDKSKYQALCEGDDYWCHPMKLQKQVDYLESHRDYSACTHQTMNVDTNCREIGLFRKDQPTGEINIMNLDKYLDFPHTSSYLFRNVKHPDNYIEGGIEKEKMCSGWDKSRVLFFYSIGKVYYFNEIMSCYRVGSGGWTHTMNTTNKTKKIVEVEWAQIRQVKAYGLPININPHYYRNVVLYSFNFFKKNTNWKNFKRHYSIHPSKIFKNIYDFI